MIFIHLCMRVFTTWTNSVNLEFSENCSISEKIRKFFKRINPFKKFMLKLSFQEFYFYCKTHWLIKLIFFKLKICLDRKLSYRKSVVEMSKALLCNYIKFKLLISISLEESFNVFDSSIGVSGRLIAQYN